MKVICIICSWFVCFSAVGQVVNVERYRIRTDTTGWFGEIGVNASFIKSNSKVVFAEANLLAEYKRTKDLFLFIANYNFLTGDGVQLIDEFMFHTRYNLKMNSFIRFELFTQYQQNELLQIKHRVLAGLGPRIKLLDNNVIRMYLGSLIMSEFEQENSGAQIKHGDLRKSSYISFTIIPFEKAEIISTTYWQPRLFTISDYRLLNQSNVKFNITKHIAVTFNLHYLFDSRPAVEAIAENSKFTTGISYKL